MLKQYDKAADMLVVGFVRCWRLYQVAQAIGVDSSSKEEMAKMIEACPFLPPDTASNYGRPVRAFIAAEWPKLAEWMADHESDPQKLVGVIPQIRKLRAHGKRGVLRSADDLREQAATRKAMKQSASSYRISREAFKTNQRSSWSTCKA